MVTSSKRRARYWKTMSRKSASDITFANRCSRSVIRLLGAPARPLPDVTTGGGVDPSGVSDRPPPIEPEGRAPTPVIGEPLTTVLGAAPSAIGEGAPGWGGMRTPLLGGAP